MVRPHHEHMRVDAPAFQCMGLGLARDKSCALDGDEKENEMNGEYIVVYVCARRSYCESYVARNGGTIGWHNGNFEVRVYKEQD